MGLKFLRTDRGLQVDATDTSSATQMGITAISGLGGVADVQDALAALAVGGVGTEVQTVTGSPAGLVNNTDPKNPIVQLQFGTNIVLDAESGGNQTDVVIGKSGALANNAVGGFLQVPSCAGLPTGTPTPVSGKIPLVIGNTATTPHLYGYISGAWVQL